MEAEGTLWFEEWPGDGAVSPGVPYFSRDGQWVVAAVGYWPLAETTGGPPPRDELGFFIWDALTGEVATRFDTGPCGSLMWSRPSAGHAIVWTPTGEACNFEEVNLNLLDLETGAMTFLAKSSSGAFGSAVSADDGVIAFDDIDFVTHVVDLESGEESLTITADDRLPTWSFVRALNADGSLLLYGDRPIQVWDIAAGGMVTTFDGHDGETFGTVAFSADGELAYSAGRDGTVRIWDPATGDELDVLGGAGNATSAVMSSDGSTMLVGDAASPAARLWDLAPVAAEVGAIDTCSGFTFANSLQMVSDQGLVSIGCGEDYFGTPHVFDVATVEIERLFPLHSGQMTALSPDGSRLAQLDGGEGSLQGPIRIYDVATGAPVVTIDTVCVWDNEIALPAQPQCRDAPDTPFALWPNTMQFSPDGSMLAATDYPGPGGHLAVWEADTGALLHVHNAPSDPALGSPISVRFLDDSRLWVNYLNRAFQILDTATWEVIEQIEVSGDDPFPDFGRLARDGTRFVGYSADQLIWYDTSTWEQVRTTPGLHRGTIKDADINPAETLIATGGSDGFIRVWDFDTGALVHQIPISGGQAQNVGFLDDQHLVVTPQDGNILVFTIDTAELLDIARDRVTRGFTDTECATYHFDHCPNLEEIRNT